jgi:Protein of unknown function (DUF632)
MLLIAIHSRAILCMPLQEWSNLHSSMHGTKSFIKCDNFQEEEKLRLRYEREWKRFKIFDESGAEASKIDSTRSVIRSLSTQLNIAMKEVKFISSRIQKLRDDELQPSLINLFQGYEILKVSYLVYS